MCIHDSNSVTVTIVYTINVLGLYVLVYIKGGNFKINLGDVLKGVVGLEEAVEVSKKEDKIRRPDYKVDLSSIESEYLEVPRNQMGHTKDLIVLSINLSDPVGKTEVPEYDGFEYIVQDTNTKLIYIAKTEKILNNNFIYRDDLDIFEIKSKEEFDKKILEVLGSVPVGKIPSQVCYVLDNPVLENYTPYYNHEVIIHKYGVSTPRGCFIRKYPNRFERDMGILKIDRKYKTTSFKDAGKVAKLELKDNEAIIISDGAYIKNITSNSVYYIDNTSMISFAECTLPSDPNQAVLISEIKGAINALSLCIARGKRRITYYYDNTPIVNCFNNRKLEYIEEVKEFKELLTDLDSKKYTIDFLEIHPKTPQEDEELNVEFSEERKGLKYLHNFCDRICTEISDIYVKGYKDKIIINRDNAIKAAELIRKQEEQKKKQNKGRRF